MSALPISDRDPEGHPLSRVTFVTVVFAAEYGLLELQARSFGAFLEHESVAQIIVIDNSVTPMSRRRTAALLRAYGPLAGLVSIVRNTEIADVPATVGWRSQQILKLRVADRVSTDVYVALDAKNHLIAPTGLDTFVAPDGRPFANFYGYENHPLRATLELVLDYFGLEHQPNIARFTATSTPFVLTTRNVRELVSSMEGRESLPFSELFVMRGFTEFFLYSAWLQASGHSLDLVFDDLGIRSAVVWPRGRDLGNVSRVLEAATGSRFLSIHRTALARMNGSATGLLADFWVARGFFRTRWAARRFIVRFRIGYVFAMVGKRISERRVGR